MLYTSVMAIPTEISSLLRLYSSKQNSPTVIIQNFSEYLEKYARHYLQEAPELVVFLDNTQAEVINKLKNLEDDMGLVISKDVRGRDIVFVPQFYIDRLAAVYKNILGKPEIPFPAYSELPKTFPSSLLYVVSISSNFDEFVEKEVFSHTNRIADGLVKIEFPNEVPPLVFPNSMSPEKLLFLVLSKVRFFLRKDESRDFIRKRMTAVSPGKDLAVKNFLIQFQTRPEEAQNAMKNGGDTYLLYNYLCSFIKQYLVKKNEKTSEEISLLQSVCVIEYFNNFFKGKIQQDLQRETALKNLSGCFQKSPYYFTMDDICRFTDSRGVPLLGQYQQQDLDAFLREKTTFREGESFAEILVFKDGSGTRYFVLKTKVEALIVRLSDSTRKVVKENITKLWYDQLCAYQNTPAMKNQNSFEILLEEECKKASPVLYGLLTASFISLLAHENFSEKKPTQEFKIFSHGTLVPLSELFMLNRQELLTDVKILLPFWYTIPIISAIVAFFKKPKAPKKVVPEDSGTTKLTINEPSQDKHEKNSRKTDLSYAVSRVEASLVPPNSSLENELKKVLGQWNMSLDAQAKKNLTEDVNSLIRDYMRRVIRTIRGSSFDIDRVRNLARTLTDIPGLQKIKNREALYVYVQLYILRIVKSTIKV